MLDKSIGTIVCIMSRQLCKLHQYLTPCATDSIWYKQMYQHNMQIMCMHHFLSTKSALKISNRSTL